MSEGREKKGLPDKLLFMYKKISVPKMALTYWFTIPEFIDAMLMKLNNGETIDNETVLPVMESIYSGMLPFRKTEIGKQFNYRLARSAINALKRKSS